MPRMLDLQCPGCEFQYIDKFFMVVPDKILCPQCGMPMERIWSVQSRPTEWSERDSVVVFKDANGKIRYPPRNDAQTPPGYERIVMRSLRQVEKFEREHGVRNEAVWYDRGSGRGFDDHFHGKAH